MSGEFTTELDCRVLVIPPELRMQPARDPAKSVLAFIMATPGDHRTAEVLLSDEERAKLREILK